MFYTVRIDFDFFSLPNVTCAFATKGLRGVHEKMDFRTVMMISTNWLYRVIFIFLIFLFCFHSPPLQWYVFGFPYSFLSVYKAFCLTRLFLMCQCVLMYECVLFCVCFMGDRSPTFLIFTQSKQ